MIDLDCEHWEAALDDALDDRLMPAQVEALRAHLAGCNRCRAIDEQLRWARASLRAADAGLRDPVLERRLGVALEVEIRTAAPAQTPDRPIPLADHDRRGVLTRRGFLVGAAALAAGIAGLLWLVRRSTPTPATLLTSLKSELDDHAGADRPSDFERLDVATLESRFAAAGLPFPTRVIDLSMMQIHVVGGSLRAVLGRPATLVLYETPIGPMLCRMILDDSAASMMPARTPALRERGFAFVSARSEDVSFVFWREGPVVCVLVARMTESELLELARAKAMA